MSAEGELPARLAGILLAAGGAARYGGAKQLALLGGVSLVERAASLLVATCPAGAVAVTGAHAAEVEAALAGLDVRTVRNPDWASGLAGSLRRGLDALPGGVCGCLVLLCDQPAVDERDLRDLVAAWESAPERVAAARYSGTLGVPAIFPARHWDAVRRLEGDHGARALLGRLPAVTAVDMPHAAWDVDVPADLAALPRL